MAYDRTRGFASGKAVKTWCDKYHMPVEVSFTVTTHGEAECIALAKGWCDRMGYFYNLWLSQANSMYIITQYDIDGWVPPETWTAAAASFKDGKGRKRLDEVISKLPRL